MRTSLYLGIIDIIYGNKIWYLYGASSNEHRNLMPNYLLQWEMIKYAIENKKDIYDFRGVSRCSRQVSSTVRIIQIQKRLRSRIHRVYRRNISRF